LQANKSLNCFKIKIQISLNSARTQNKTTIFQLSKIVSLGFWISMAFDERLPWREPHHTFHPHLNPFPANPTTDAKTKINLEIICTEFIYGNDDVI